MAKAGQGFGCFSSLGLVFFLFFLGFIIIRYASEDRIASTRAANKHVEARVTKEFAASKKIILQQIKILLNKKEFDAAFSVANKYASVEDQELNQLVSAVKESKLYEEVKKVPASDWAKNAKMYLELKKLAPGKKLYAQKISYYQEKIDQAEKERVAAEAKLQKERAAGAAKIQKETAALEAKFGKAPIRSAWDGSVYEVEKYLKGIANDSDSIEIDGCSKVYHTDGGWLVGCKYGGKNAFGGMVRNTNWFVISHGQIIEVLDASAYNLP